MTLRRLSKAIDGDGEDMHEVNIYSVLFAAITVNQFVNLEIPDYVTTIFKIAQKMVMHDELDLMKKWPNSHWETNLKHDSGPAPLKAVQVPFTGFTK